MTPIVTSSYLFRATSPFVVDPHASEILYAGVTVPFAEHDYPGASRSTGASTASRGRRSLGRRRPGDRPFDH
jgi:hypothetical protein